MLFSQNLLPSEARPEKLSNSERQVRMTLLTKTFLPIVAFLFCVSTVIGAIRNYSPVPFKDMWDRDCYIDFYEQVSNGYWRAWWAQVNEHRPVFSRVFFWLDIRFFHGLSLILIPLNLTLMALIWLALLVGARHLFKGSPPKNIVATIGALLAMVCFSWMQKENITWAFQSMFFAACLFPMFAFHCFAFSASESRSNLWFAAALAFGVVSVGTMANGIMALPLMVLMAIMLRQSKERISILVLASVLAFATNYTGPGTFGSLGSSLKTHPIEVLEFLLVYLGGPFRVIFNDFWVAALTGLAFLVGCAFCLARWLQGKATAPMFLSFLIFLAYIGATALATTSGRIKFGVDGAAASRYTTPVLLGWAALSILLASQFHAHPRFSGAALVISVVVPLLLLPSQLDSVRVDPTVANHQRMIAALALDLGIKDRESIASIYPWDTKFDIINNTAALAGRRHLSVFSLPTLRNAQRYLHQPADTLPLRECQSHIDTITSMGGAVGVSRISGWAFDAEQGRVPTEVFFVDSGNNVVGTGLTGMPHADAGSINQSRASLNPLALTPGPLGSGLVRGLHFYYGPLAGFDGYLFGEKKNVRVFCPR